MVINLGIDGAVRKSPFGLVIYTADANCQIIAPLRCHFCIRLFIYYKDGTASEDKNLKKVKNI